MREPCRYFVVWTLQRGLIDPPEPVSPELLPAMNRQHELDDLDDERRRALHYQASAPIQWERDPLTLRRRSPAA